MSEMLKTYEEELETKEGFKKTNIGWIPDDWKVSTIANVFDFLKTNSLSRKQLNNEPLDENSIFNIHYGDIHSSFKYEVLDVTKESALPKVVDNQLIKSKPDYLRDGDLVMADASEDYEGICDCVELKNVNNVKLVSGLHTFALRDKGSNFIDGFKSYLFKNQKVIKSIYRVATGISVLGVSKSNLSKIKIPIPTLLEQQKIASILSDWDLAIEKTHTLIEKLQQRKEGFMQHLLTGKIRLAGFSDDWLKVSIKEIATQFTDKNKNDEEIEVLSCTKYDGLVRSLDYFGRKVFGDDLSKYKIVPKGYFAYATNHIEEGSIGYQDLMDRGLVSPMYTVFKTNEMINDSFMYRLLKTDRMIYNYQSNMSGSIARRGGLRWNVFETIIVSIPLLEEQNALADFFDKIDEEIHQSEKYLEQLHAQKKGLMQQLLTGKIRVN